MSYDIYMKDGEKAVIVLGITEEGRAYVASQFASSVSEKSRGRFDEEETLVRNGFGLYRADANKFQNNYSYAGVAFSLIEAINFCKKENNLISNNNKNMRVNILEKYEQDAYFTKENLAKASQVNSNIKLASSSLRRVADLLSQTASKVEHIEDLVNESANSYDIEGTKKSLEIAEKVLSALSSDKLFSFAIETGKTKLEKDLEEFNVETFLSE